VKKAKQAEEGQAELESKSEELKKKKIFLQNRKIILENELESLQKSFKEIKDIEEARRKTELSYLQNQTKHLDSFLKSVQANSN
jgi:dynein light intermediate chain